MDKTERAGVYEVKSERGRRKMEELFIRAVQQGNPTAVTLCLSKGVYPNIFDEDDMAAIHTTACKGDLLVGQQLLRHPQIKIDLRTPSGYTALMLACMYEQRNFLKELLRKGADPNILTDRDQSALHMACVVGNLGIVTDLTAAGADVNAVDEFDNTPLSIAAADHPSGCIVRHLLRKGASATERKQIPLLLEGFLSCNSEERLDILRLLVHYSNDVNCVHPISKMSALHYVGITGYLPAAEFLLTNGANLHLVDRSNRIPLNIAEDHQNREVIRLYRRWGDRKRVIFSSTENIIQDIHRLYE